VQPLLLPLLQRALPSLPLLVQGLRAQALLARGWAQAQAQRGAAQREQGVRAQPLAQAWVQVLPLQAQQPRAPLALRQPLLPMVLRSPWLVRAQQLQRWLRWP